MALERTGNGYLVDPSIWSEEVMFEMAKEDAIVILIDKT
jgi:tRNA 2-thiouridine synthesizing protein E